MKFWEAMKALQEGQTVKSSIFPNGITWILGNYIPTLGGFLNDTWEVVPAKVIHKCENQPWVCEELSPGQLSYEDTRDPNMTFSMVNFCPICGYKPEGK